LKSNDKKVENFENFKVVYLAQNFSKCFETCNKPV